MATIKFSEFDPGNITAVGAQVVGLEGGNNKIFNAADLVNGLASTSYVDAQDTNLQNQITQNANDIANIDIDVGNIEVDTSEIEANIAILQGNVTVIEGNIVVLEGAVAALQNNVTVNTDDITTIQGNIVQIENDLANINYSNANVQALGESGWTGNIVPSANITYDLGNTTNRWKDLYLSNATIYLGSTELSTANGVITVDGKKVKNTFGTTTSIVNTSTDVYNRNGPLPADPKGMAVADPNGKSGWYWKSPGPTADPSGLNAFQWKMFNNDGPQTFTVADIDYIYMIVDLYTTGQVYFNVFTAGINPAPTAFQSRFSFVYGGTFPSTGRYLMWAKPPGSDITVDDVEVYPFLERLELPYSVSGSSGTLLTSETIKSLNVQTRSNPALNEGEVEFTLKNVGYKVNNSYIQNFDMEIYGGDQSLSLDNSSNVLSISGGNSVDFTPVLANVSGGGGSGNYGDANVAAYLNGNLSTSIIPDTNSAYDIGSAEYKIRHLFLSDNSLYFVDASNVQYPLNVQGEQLFFNGEQLSGGGGGNPFDQTLNTTDDVTFSGVTINGNMDVNGAGTHTFQGTIEFSQLTNFGGTVGITDILDEDDMNSNSPTALATQQSVKAYVDSSVQAAGGYSNATVTAYAEDGWQGNIIPDANITYDLGSPTNAWKDLYLSNSTIYLGGQTISVESDGTIAFSGNISAPAVVDYTKLILNDGVLTTSRAGSTDGLEWESVVIPSSGDGETIRGVVGNDSGILAFTRYAEITYSLDNGVTWQIIHINDDLGYMGFDRYNRTVPYYSPGLNLFYILGSDGYYFTTSDFQTFSGQQQANVNWGYLGSQPPSITESDTRLLFVEPTSRKVYYADIANPSVWTEVANPGLGTNNGVDALYTGSAFVIVSIAQSSCRVSTDNGVTWSNGGDLKGGAGGSATAKTSDVDPDTGTIVVGMNFNSISISTDNGSNWTLTNMDSVFTAYPSNAQIRNVSYGAGLWCVNAGAYGGFDDWYDTQYVSEDITDLNTWKIINTNVPGPYSLEDQTYVNGNFWGPADDVLFKLEWPVGTQVLLFNDDVIATRKDLAYVAVAHEQAQAEKVATKELEILSKTFDANANVSQSSTLTYESNALHISGDVEVEGNINILGFTNKQEYVDIRDYGAVGGNVTLDTQAWDDALDAIVAAGGGTLVLPRLSERYHINVATPDIDNTPQSRDYSNVTIRGGGEIYIEQVNGCLIHIGENTDGFLIEDLDILIAASASGGGFNKGTILSNYGNINRVTIRDLTIKNEVKPDLDGGPYAINFSQDVTDPTDTAEIQNVTVENCDIELYGRANYAVRFIRKSKFSKVLNNRITLHAWQSQTAQSFNTIAMYGWAEEFLIQGNSIFGSGHSAIACSMAFNGIVKENFVKNVTNPVEAGIEVENKWGHARDDVLYTTNGIKVINNIVQNCEYGILVTNRNADEPTSRGTYNILIEGNSVYDSEASDIMVFDKLSGTPATANTHSDIRITNNSCFSNAPNGGIRMYTGKDSAINANHVKGQNVGIHIGRSSDIFVQGFINILGNTVEDHTTHGIHVESGNAILRVSENNVSNVTNRGFLLSTCQGGTHIYNNNYVEDTGQDAYYIRANPENRKGSMFRGNRAFRAGSKGFYVDMYDSIISENIDVDSSTTNTFTNNANTTTINNLTF